MQNGPSARNASPQTSDAFGSARTTVIAALSLALAGAVFGLTAGRWTGAVTGAEVWLTAACVVFCAGILLILLRQPFDRNPWIAPASGIFFLLYLALGALLSLRDPSLLGSYLVYLLWFFPLLAFNRFVNVAVWSGRLSLAIYSTAVLLAVARIVTRGEDAEATLLVVYCLSVTAFALILGLFAKFREAYIQEQERTHALEKTSAAVRASEERFRHLFANAASGIGWLGLDGRCQHVNDTFGRMMGRAPDSLLGTAFADLVHPEDRPNWDRLLEEMQGEARPEAGAELRMLDAGGRMLRTRLSFARLAAHADERPALAFVCLDDTEAHEMEARLHQAQRLEAVGRLTGGIAHDFNNLLTVILGSADALEQQLSVGSDLRALAEMSRTAAERGALLTRQLLAFSRRQTLAPRVTDIGALLAGVRTMLQRTLGENFEIGLTAEPNLWMALVDPVQLESAVLNLAINSRDAMPAGGRLLIEVDNARFATNESPDDAGLDTDDADISPGEYVLIAVTDAGSGVPPEILPRVFEPFFTTKETGKGSGLGLSMVYGFVKQSRGHVRIYSEVGRGTTVKIFLPRTAAHDAEDPPDLRAEEVLGGSSTVLVVEDNDLVRKLVTAQLQRLGYHVLQAANGPEALEILRSGAPVDLLFSDIVMPGGIDGIQLIEKARLLRPRLGVLLTSGFTEDAVIQQGRTPPGVSLLSKPYRINDLADRVAAALAAIEPPDAAPLTAGD